eukprot:2824212-Pyramimonas_sp.AAC.1
MGPPTVQQPARLVSTAPTEAVNAVAHTNTGTCRVFKVEAVELTYWLGVAVTLRIGSLKSTRERKESARLNRLRRLSLIVRTSVYDTCTSVSLIPTAAST